MIYIVEGEVSIEDFWIFIFVNKLLENYSNSSVFYIFNLGGLWDIIYICRVK